MLHSQKGRIWECEKSKMAMKFFANKTRVELSLRRKSRSSTPFFVRINKLDPAKLDWSRYPVPSNPFDHCTADLAQLQTRKSNDQGRGAGQVGRALGCSRWRCRGRRYLCIEIYIYTSLLISMYRYLHKSMTFYDEVDVNAQNSGAWRCDACCTYLWNPEYIYGWIYYISRSKMWRMHILMNVYELFIKNTYTLAVSAC